MNNNTQITKTNDLESLISSPEMQAKFASALPKHLSPDRFARIAILALTRTPKLRECSQESLFKCLFDLTAMGLEPDGRHAHLIPYGKECTLIVDYKGIVSIVRRDPSVVDVQCIAIRENDECQWVNGEMKHTINPKISRGEVCSTYTRIAFSNGTISIGEPFSKDDAEHAKKSSKTSNAGPWKDHYVEMWKKSNIKRDSKMWPLSPEVRDLIQASDEHEFAPIRNVTPSVSIPLIEQKPSTANPYKPKDEPKSEVQLPCKSGSQIAIFKELESASGTNAKTGKDWVKYNVKFTDAEGKEGSASTFSESLIAPLEFAQAGEKIEIETEPASNPKYAPTLTGLRMIVESPQPEGEKKDLW